MTNLKAPTLIDVVVKHEQEIQELKRLLTPMMEFGREKHTAKCAVKDCENRMGQGYFNGFLCSPCHRFVSGEEGVYSQAYRNSRKMIDTAVEMERSKKEWVDLTADEATIIWERVDERDGWELIMQVQKKLKDKNT